MKKSQSKLMNLSNSTICKLSARAIMSIYNIFEGIIYSLLSMPLHFIILHKKIKHDPKYLSYKTKKAIQNTTAIVTKPYCVTRDSCVTFAKSASTKTHNIVTNTINIFKQFVIADIKKTTEDVQNVVNTIYNGVKTVILSPVYLCKYVVRSIKDFGHKTYNASCNAIKQLNKPIYVAAPFSRLKDFVFCKRSQIYVLSAIILGIATLSIKWYNNQLAAIHEQYGVIANKIQNLNNSNASTTDLSNKMYSHVIQEQQPVQADEPKQEITKQEETPYDPIAALKDKVENYFAQHRTTEVLASNDKCRLKVDNEVINDHSYIPGLADIRIDGADEDYITFSDNLGNSYAKPIVTLFQ